MSKPTSINQLIAQDKKRLSEYHKRRKAARKTIDKLGRGARAKCGFELRIAPTSISRCLNGQRISLVTLERIEDWLENQE